MTEQHRAKWLGIITNQYVSSEEIEDDTITMHTLKWRLEEYVNVMFNRIDAYCTSLKSLQARCQMKRTILELPQAVFSQVTPPPGLLRLYRR